VFKEFQVEQDHGYRRSTKVVEEPHSFDVQVEASHAGQTHEWRYTSYEGRVELASEAVAEAGIGVERAEPRWIAETVTAYGRIAPNENRLAFVIPRYAGTVREVHKLLGDTVEEGEVLASVESNDSLRPYEVRAPISGSIVEKNVAAGEFVDQTRPIYKVADLGTVWVDLNVYAEDALRLESGQQVVIRGAGKDGEREGRISYLSPFGDEHSQTTLARVELGNADGRLRPGLFVTGAVEVDRVEVPVAVRTEALQTFRDWEVVFVKEGDVFQAMPVVTGRRGGGWIEIVSGIEAEQEVATTNSFVLKADLLKSGVVHEH
jgi:cobalt-zinc-cadmium efflux system membrane fusion protein